MSGFSATGASTFFGSEVTGSVVFGGSQFHATGSDAALDWSAATIGGVLVAQPEMRDGRRTKWTVNGRVEMFALSVKANVNLTGTVDLLFANRLTVLGDTTLTLLVKTRFALDGGTLRARSSLPDSAFPALSIPMPRPLMSFPCGMPTSATHFRSQIEPRQRRST